MKLTSQQQARPFLCALGFGFGFADLNLTINSFGLLLLAVLNETAGFLVYS
jgi:hypothetical protein